MFNAKTRQMMEGSVEALLMNIEPETLISGEGGFPELRKGLKDTPKRVVKMYEEIFQGYQLDPESILSEKTFDDDGLDMYKGMVIVRDIQFYAHCEHHMVPFFGTADVAYIPEGRVVGLSKLARLVDCYSKRLTVQERMTDQIVDALMNYLLPKGAIAVVKAEHLCMCMRGVKKPGARTITSSIRGVFKDNAEARAEFMALCETGRI